MLLSNFRVLSFDCYGTLIDWETGIIAALQPLLSRSGQSDTTRDSILESFARLESLLEAERPRLLYRDILAEVHNELAAEWRVEPSPDEARAFGSSVGAWPPFPDSGDALRYLGHHFKLVILSNVDRESFEGSRERLGVTFDHVFTAQDIGSYKPDPRNFAYLTQELSKLGFEKGDILHTAESLFHDHAPANAAGLASAWIHRRHGSDGFGATRQPDVMPHFDFHFTSLSEMADAHRQELASS